MKNYSTHVLFTDRSVQSVNLLLKDIRKYRPLDKSEEYQLWQRIRQGDVDARNQLVLCNMGYVVTRAKQYYYTRVPLEDLVSAGLMGLIMAAERFDGSLNFRFITYAKNYIDNEICKTVSKQNRLVLFNAPANKDDMSDLTIEDTLSADEQYAADWALERTNEYEMNAQSLRQKYGRPNAQLYIDYLQMTSKGYGLSDVAKKYHLPEQHVKEIIRKIKYSTHSMSMMAA